MSLLIGFLTFILVVDALFLMLLVLVQLPKKEAGAGLAFGAGAVDTLIGAGSGNALTKLTKYAAGVFLGLAVLLAVLNAQRHESSSRTLQRELAKKSSAAPVLQNQPASAPTSGKLSNNAAAPLADLKNAMTSAPALQLLTNKPLDLQPTATPPASTSVSTNAAQATPSAPAQPK